MKDIIEEIIAEKPHLADPFRFYGKILEFRASVEEVPLPGIESQAAFPPESLDRIFGMFSSILGLPEGTLGPLKQAMDLREIDFTRIPLGEIPAFSLPYAEDDLAILLSLLSKPFFLALRDARPMENRSWEEGRCPVCHAQPAITWIIGDRRRQVSCSFCDTAGYVNRTGCPVCLAVDAKEQNILVAEGDEKVRINTCNVCHSYVKTVDAGMFSRYTPEIADLLSLPLDILVQEKGYERRAPNPIGLRKISK